VSPLTGRAAARGAAWGSGGIVGATAVAAGVLAAQLVQARRTIGPQRGVPPYQDGRFGPPIGTSVRLAVLGDSVGAGLGADTAADTVAGVLVRGVGAATGRPVLMTNHAVVGAKSADLERQVTRALTTRPHVAVLIIGANDVTHLVPERISVRHLRAAIDRLVASGTQVIVGTCPDLGTVRPLSRQLRWVGRNRSRSLAAAQRAVTLEAGGHPVSLHDTLGPEFEANAETMFAPDRFHPSSLGYRRLGAQILPVVLRCLGIQQASDRKAIAAARTEV
jgi:lysophospholipase L1-like esterase